MKTLIALFISCTLLFGCSQKPSLGDKLQDGDLLFQGCIPSDFTNAINQATGTEPELQFEHVGIFARIDGKPMVIEAEPENGVTITPLHDFYDNSKKIVPVRIKGLDAEATLQRALSFIGKDYDWEFDPENDKIYCSELVQASYLYPSGKQIFKSIPMNFLNAKGEMPKLWIDLFEELQKPIPQGMPGTNPNSLYHFLHHNPSK